MSKSGKKNMTCIYCLNKFTPNFSGDGEHVIPSAFLHNFPLKYHLRIYNVCRNCNSEFGHTIDAEITDNSLESFIRHLSGRLTSNANVRIPIMGISGKWIGEHLTIKNNEIVPIELIVEFYHDNKCVLESPLSKIDNKQIKELSKYGNNLVVVNYGDKNGKRLQYIKNKLEKLGCLIKLEKNTMSFDDIQSQCQVQGTYCVKHFQAIAKIAFNYLSYINRDEYEFCLCPSFDEIRSFIKGKSDHTLNFGVLKPDYRFSLQPTTSYLLGIKGYSDGSIVSFIDLGYLHFYILLKRPNSRPFNKEFSSFHASNLENNEIKEISENNFKNLFWIPAYFTIDTSS